MYPQKHLSIFENLKSDYSYIKKYADNPSGSLSQHNLKQQYDIIYMDNNCHTGTIHIFEFTPSENSYYDFLLQEEEKERTQEHKHNFYELMIILKGILFQNMDGKNYTFHQGDCYIINRNVQHYEYLTTDFQVAFLDLSDDLIMDLMKHDVTYHPDGTFTRIHNEIYDFINFEQSANQNLGKHLLLLSPTKSAVESNHFLLPFINDIITNSSGKESGYFFTTEASLCKFFSALSNSEYYTSNHHYTETTQKEQLYIRILQEIKYSNGQISWDHLKAKLHYSAEYLNKIMKQYSGLSLNQYSLRYRLEMVEKKLIHADGSIEEISQQFGFTNRSYFYRVFHEKYGCTPKEYRRQHRDEYNSL